MAEDGRKPGSADRDESPDEAELERRLKALQDRLERKDQDARDAAPKGTDRSGIATAMRLSSEFIAAVLVGAALGWGLDRFLGLAPWGMIVFLLLGFCAGIVNVLRAAGRMSDPHGRRGEGPGGSSGG